MALSKLGVECKFIKDTDYVVGFPSKKITKVISGNKKLKKLISQPLFLILSVINLRYRNL